MNNKCTIKIIRANIDYELKEIDGEPSGEYRPLWQWICSEHGDGAFIHLRVEDAVTEGEYHCQLIQQTNDWYSEDHYQ